MWPTKGEASAAYRASLEGDAAWFEEHGRRWKSYGEAIRRVPLDSDPSEDPGVVRARNEMEAHLGQAWPPGGTAHGGGNPLRAPRGDGGEE